MEFVVVLPLVVTLSSVSVEAAAALGVEKETAII
jgi:hypothetical protein